MNTLDDLDSKILAVCDDTDVDKESSESNEYQSNIFFI